MPDIVKSDQMDGDEDGIPLMLKSHELRIAKLENGDKKTIFKRLTESGNASALFLGLILTFLSIREAGFIKPEADRISRISNFNQAVNAAGQKMQEQMRLELQQAVDAAGQKTQNQQQPAVDAAGQKTQNQQQPAVDAAGQKTQNQQQQAVDADGQKTQAAQRLVLAMKSATTTQILNDISTAKAILRDLEDKDVGISQLFILIYAAYSAGDVNGAEAQRSAP